MYILDIFREYCDATFRTILTISRINWDINISNWKSKRDRVNLVESNGNDSGTLRHLRVNSGYLMKERFSVLFFEAKESNIFTGGSTGNQQELICGVAEGVNGNAFKTLFDYLRWHGPGSVLGYPGPWNRVWATVKVSGEILD